VLKRTGLKDHYVKSYKSKIKKLQIWRVTTFKMTGQELKAPVWKALMLKKLRSGGRLVKKDRPGGPLHQKKYKPGGILSLKRYNPEGILSLKKCIEGPYVRKVQAWRDIKLRKTDLEGP
jgi:hypothetical protein